MNRYDNLIESREHRTDPFPAGPWIVYQQWKSVLFLHWCVRSEQLQSIIPPELEPDLYDGWAWISVAVFQIDRLHARGVPPLPYLSQLTEMNARTYVRHRGVPGIFFLDLKADNVFLMFSLRMLTGLPYRKAKFRCEVADTVHNYQCINGDKDILLDIDFTSVNLLASKCALDVWLTERYYSYYTVGRRTFCLPVHHPEWSLKSCEIEQVSVDIDCYGQRITGRDIILSHYCEEIEVLGWPRRLVHPLNATKMAGRSVSQPVVSHRIESM